MITGVFGPCDDGPYCRFKYSFTTGATLSFVIPFVEQYLLFNQSLKFFVP